MSHQQWTPGVLLTVCALALTGCSTMLTSMTNARALEPGEVQATANAQVTLQSQGIGGLVEGVEAIEQRFESNSDEQISEEDFRTWVDAVLLIALFTPGVGGEFGARVGVTDDVLEGIDVGLRTDLSVVRGDLKLQLWQDPRSAQAVSAALAYTHHLGLVSGAFEYATFTSFSRGDVELQVLWDLQATDYLRFTLAPRVILGRISAESTIPTDIFERLPAEIQQYDPSRFFRDEWIAHYGANATVMAGYKYVWIAFDVGLYGTTFQPQVFGSRRDYSGGAVAFGGGLSGNYAF